jgi:hypothetical protein
MYLAEGTYLFSYYLKEEKTQKPVTLAQVGMWVLLILSLERGGEASLVRDRSVLCM